MMPRRRVVEPELKASLGVHALWLPFTVWLIVGVVGIAFAAGARHVVRHFHADTVEVVK
jgi:hypothetical protein